MDIIAGLQNKDNAQAYSLLLQLKMQSESSDELYGYFDDFIGLLKSGSSFVRTRGFCLACAQAKWDTENKLEKNADALLCMLDDAKPTAVRQCLSALHTVILYKPDLSGKIAEKLKAMDMSKYKDSISPLIEKDIKELQKAISE